MNTNLFLKEVSKKIHIEFPLILLKTSWNLKVIMFPPTLQGMDATHSMQKGIEPTLDDEFFLSYRGLTNKILS